MVDPNGGSVAKKPCSDPRIQGPQSGRKSSGGDACASLSKKKLTMGNDIPDELQSTTSSTLSSSVMQVGSHTHFLDQ